MSINKVGDASLIGTSTNASNINAKTQVKYDTAYRMCLASTECGPTELKS